MYTVIKRMEVSAAHSLNLSYQSKCENLHGHNWIITVYCRAKELNADGMSFLERGLTAAAAATYAESASEPQAFEDASAASTKYNASKPSSVSPKWNAGAGDEEKLERIITQKWIAMFPNGQEAWSEFRRTGYPKVIPIVNNLSGGKVDTNVQVRRMTFPRSEYSNNAAGVAAATALLGGADTGGTKLWWDKK